MQETQESPTSKSITQRLLPPDGIDNPQTDYNLLNDQQECPSNASSPGAHLETMRRRERPFSCRLETWCRCLFWTLPILLTDAFRLGIFVILMTPGFCRFVWFYCVASDRVSAPYATESCRQTLDVYRAAPSQSPRPVVVFFTGGAWMIGYKMWGSLLARCLTALGVVVVIPDYRNYPWGTVGQAVGDVQLSLQWTLDHVREYGGDPKQVVVVGQSAGGHLAVTALLRVALERMGHVLETPTAETVQWKPTDFKACIALSSPYCLTSMKHSFVKHGMDNQLVESIFGGDTTSYSPLDLVERYCLSETAESKGRIAEYLPPMGIYHGRLDKTVPILGSNKFVAALERAGVRKERLEFVSYSDWAHTESILEGPMAGDHRFHRHLYNEVRKWTAPNVDDNLLKNEVETEGSPQTIITHHPTLQPWPDISNPAFLDPICPTVLVQMARYVNPI